MLQPVLVPQTLTGETCPHGRTKLRLRGLLQSDARFVFDAVPVIAFLSCFSLRPAVPSLEQLPLRQLPSMPITAEQAALWSPPGHADSLIPFPQGRLTVADGRRILDTTVAVVQCFVPGQGHPAIFPSLTKREQDLCSWILKREGASRVAWENKRETLHAFRTALNDEAFLRAYGHEHDASAENTNVPFLRVSSYMLLSDTSRRAAILTLGAPLQLMYHLDAGS